MGIKNVLNSIDLKTCLKIIRFSLKSMKLGLRGLDPQLLETKERKFIELLH